MATPVNSTITPWFTTSGLNSDEMRHALSALVASDSPAGISAEIGIFPGLNAALVAGVGGTSVTVQPFQATVRHATGATYIVTFPSSVSVPIDSNASNTRYDRLIVEILDTEVTAGDGAKVARLRAVSGTAAASPTEPALPNANVLEIARLSVVSGSISVVDRRTYTRTSGGVRLASATDNRSGAYPGDLRGWASGRMDVWTGAAWVTTVTPSAWTQENVTLNSPGGVLAMGSTGFGNVRYKRTGNDLTMHYHFSWGGTGINGRYGTVSTQLPAGMTSGPRLQWVPVHLFINGSAGVQDAQHLSSLALISPNTSEIIPFFPILPFQTPVDVREDAFSVSSSVAGIPASGVPRVPGGYATIAGSNLTIGPITIEVAP